MANKFEDLWDCMVGQEIGGGQYRTVYECKWDTDYVVKVEEPWAQFHNVLEWSAWLEVKNMPKLKGWFAPCVRISPCGLVLIQKRTTPLPKEQAPEKVPSVITDMKLENWGLLEGRPVCHDYGFIISTLSTRMRKAKWT